MNLGYRVSKNRTTTTISLDEERARRLRELASQASEKISPFVARLIDAEWDRIHGETPLDVPAEVRVA